MVDFLVHRNDHFILSGPPSDEATALALVWHWSIIQIGEAKSSSFGQWHSWICGTTPKRFSSGTE
jgi:hypothetical protein